MKEKKTTSKLKSILVTCASQAKDYGSCVAAKVPEVERDMCSKEFLALKSCMQNLPTISLGGSGALSHVFIQHPPLRCNVPGSRGFYYDDANRLLLSLTSNQVFAWKVGPLAPPSAPSVDLIGEGPVLSVRYSLDGNVIGIQRSNHEIQFKNRETGQFFTQRCKSESGSILGFFWTDCSSCDVIIIRTSGLDLFSYEPELKALRLVETKRLSVSWYIYTHESRLVLLASGMQCKTFCGFQFSSGGVIRLPQFEMAMAKAEVNTKPVLAGEDVHIVTIYGRIYCLQVDKVAMLLHVYRFYRDAVVRQGSLPIYSNKIAVNVVDNVLLVHQVDAKVVILYDIFLDCRAPISAPLPLLLRSMPRAASSRSGGRGAVPIETHEMNDQDGIIYGDGWTFLVPDLICDSIHGNIWRIHLDLEAIAASSSEAPSVLEFLQRRKSEAHKAKQLCLAIIRTLIVERRPVPIVSKAMDVLVASYSHSLKVGTVGGEKTSITDDSRRVADDSRRVADESTSGVETHGEPIKHESVSTVSKESRETRREDVENESADKANRSSTYSESEGNVGTEQLNEISLADAAQSSLQSQTLRTGGALLDSDVSGKDSQVASSAVSPDEMYTSVFALTEEEMAGEPTYLVAVLVEYFRSVTSEKLKVHPYLNVMIVQLLARSERYAELGLFVVHKILEPSKEVAFQLLESGRQNLQTRKLGMDMLRQLSLHHDYVLLLVQDGYYLEALRYARKNKVNTIRPSLFLEAALASNDSQHLAAVLRFFLDFIPGFMNTSDHDTYRRALNEMNSTICT